MAVRKLRNGDEEALESFLKKTANTSMHIRSNLKREGFAWDGKRHQGLYYGAFDGDGNISGMIGYFWNGNILMQPGESLPLLLDALRQENIEIKGLLGPAQQVRKAITLLGLESWPMQISRDEDVYVLEMAELIIPPALANKEVTARVATEDDRTLIEDWRLAFNIEALGAADTPETRQEIASEIDGKIIAEGLTILEKDGTPVAMSGKDESLPDSVTIGPVWTPPAQRGNGYARAVVAGSLLQSKEQGGTRSILFTDNLAAAKAYQAVGFKKVDQYGLTLLAKPFRFSPS